MVHYIIEIALAFTCSALATAVYLLQEKMETVIHYTNKLMEAADYQDQFNELLVKKITQELGETEDETKSNNRRPDTIN